jgi:CubicO group peptidase (beta-lactamase class C family)
VYHFREQAAAGLNTTVSDYARFVAAMMTHTALFEPVPIQPGPLDRVYGLFEQTHSLGGVITKTKRGETIVEHTGNNHGWNNAFQFAPNTGDGIVVLTNGGSKQVYKAVINKWRDSLAAPR